MSNDPFADLGETLGEDGEGDNAETAEAAAESSGDSTTLSEASDKGQTSQQDINPDPIRDAAFSYDQANQRPFYAREETITDFDAWLNYELEAELNARGYRNIRTREMTDALLKTVTKESLTEEVAEQFEKSRKNAHHE
jgi:hypothetical protein